MRTITYWSPADFPRCAGTPLPARRSFAEIVRKAGLRRQTAEVIEGLGADVAGGRDDPIGYRVAQPISNGRKLDVGSIDQRQIELFEKQPLVSPGVDL